MLILYIINVKECHEYIRVLSQEAGDKVKMEGLDNDLIERIKAGLAV